MDNCANLMVCVLRITGSNKRPTVLRTFR